MQGKIFGIPLILVLLIAGIAGLVDVPMFYMTQNTMRKVDTALLLMNESNQRVVNCTQPIVVPTPVMTPKPTLKVTKTSTTPAVLK